MRPLATTSPVVASFYRIPTICFYVERGWSLLVSASERSYNLYGHSFGAMVAHKMAEVLEAQNIKVTLLLGDFEALQYTFDTQGATGMVKAGPRLVWVGII